MPRPDDDFLTRCRSADENTPFALAMRFEVMSGGDLLIEMFDGQGEPISVALVSPDRLEKIERRFMDAVRMCRSLAEPGLASMMPEGCA